MRTLEAAGYSCSRRCAVTTSTPLAPALDHGGEDIRPDPRPGSGEPPAAPVIVGVDGSECGLAAAKWAAQEAARRNAPLRIVYAVHAPRRRGAAHEPHPELPHLRRVTAQAYTVAKHTEPGVRASTEIVPGDAATVLVTAAGEGQLVVLGKSTTGAIDEWVRAPVAVRVSARSLRPVVLVARGAVDPGRPVCAVLGFGDPEDDERVAEFAAEAAQRSGTSLAVLQTRGPRSSASGGWIQEESEWQRRFPGLEVRRTDLPRATPLQVLGSTCPATLIALSAGHGSLLHRELDGPHRWLLRHCPSPMALVPPVHRPELEPCEEIIAVG